MSLLCHSLITLCLASFASGVAFHRRGSVNESAPYFNVTLITASSARVSPASHLPVPSETSSNRHSIDVSDTSLPSDLGFVRPTGAPTFGSPALSNGTTSTQEGTYTVTSQSSQDVFATSGSAPFPINDTATLATRVSNATCTINIPNASVDYWYEATYSHLVGTMTTQAANFSNAESLTLVPHTTTFDAASALVSDFVCTLSESYYPEFDWTVTACVDYTEKPTAAATSLAYRTAYSPFPSGGLIPATDAGLYDIYYPEILPLATTALLLAPNFTQIETSATPFVYFTAYEVESGNTTETVQLSSARAYPYWLKGVERESIAKGPIPTDFLEQIPQSACDAGELQATVTVIIVVDLYYLNLPNLNPFIIHFESSVLGFDDPPVIVNNFGSSTAPPITVADWTLPGTTAKPTSIKPNNRPDPVPTTQDRMGDGNNAATQDTPALEPPQPTQVTVGNIGSNPVIIGPSSEVVVGSQTLQPGGPPVVIGGGTPVSLAPSGTAIVVGGTTSLLPHVFVPPSQPLPRPPPVLTIGSSTFTPNAATQFFVGPGQTLTPGGVATVDGTVVSLAPSASFVVVGGSTQVLPTGPGQPPSATVTPQIIVGGTTITAQPTQQRPDNSGFTFVVSGQTLAPGGSAITVAGTTLSLAPSASFVVVDGITSSISNHAMPTITVGDAVLSAFPDSSGPTFVVGDKTLAPGGPAITVSGTTLSLAPSGSFVVINGATSKVGNAAAPAFTAPTVTVGNDVFSPLPGSLGTTFVIDGQTLAPGGPAITVSGTTLSLAPSASFVVINGATSILTNPAAAQITAPPLTIGDVTFRPLPGTGTAYLIGSMLLTPGGSVVIADTTISLASGATALVINGQTSFISSQAQPVITNPPLLTIGSHTYTAVSGGGTAFIIDGQTLTPGGTITVDGTTISLAPEATELIYGSSGRSTTTALFPATTTHSQSVTSTSNARARASGTNGQAAATSSKEGSASHIDTQIWLFFSVIVILSYLLA